MDNPRKGRVEERHFLNLPGYHAGAYVLAYIQDTSKLEVRLPTAEDPKSGTAPVPRMLLEISDCSHRVELWFELEDPDDRINAFHKINTLIGALQAFRDGMEAEAMLRRQRTQEIERVRAELTAPPSPVRAERRPSAAA